MSGVVVSIVIRFVRLIVSIVLGSGSFVVG